jgi:DNA-binding response OmpR family regulator
MSKGRLLFLVSDDWRDQVREVFEQDGFEILIVSSLEDAIELIEDAKIRAVVASHDWIVDKGDNSTGLVEALKDRLPMFGFIRTWHSNIWETFFSYRYGEYIHPPFAPDEMLRRLNAVLEKFDRDQQK